MFKFNTARKQLKHEGKIRDVIVGRVYKIFNSVNDMIYIGSTTMTLTKRWGDHMTTLNKIERQYNLLKNINTQYSDIKINIEFANSLYKHMLKLGRKKFSIELIDITIVDNINQLTELEQKHINTYNPDILLNMKRANINE